MKRLALVAIVFGVIVYALQGGEYGTTDLVHQRARRRAMMAEIDSLQHQVDSLTRLKKRLESDPALQERVAREEFGMVRGDKELLYRFTDSTRAVDTVRQRRP
jgi:cell division protein FtsB